MAFRAKPRTPVPSHQMAEMYLREVVKYSGNLNSLRMGHRITRREAEAKLWLVVAWILLTLWRYVLDLIEKQRKTESMLAEMRKPPHIANSPSETPERQTEPSHSGAFLKRRA